MSLQNTTKPRPAFYPQAPRIALGVEYNGYAFKGWQSQRSGVRTVQQCVEKALSKVANQPIAVMCAGRTDTGVHGTEQVIHIETDIERSMYSWAFGANSQLPDDVSITWACPMPGDFHARFSAIQRHYRYIILNRKVRPAIKAGQVTWFYHDLDVTRMQAAAEHLLGRHDFSAYRAKGCQAKSPIRHISRLQVERFGETIHIEVSANAFLQHMVRNIAGVLMTIGRGKAPPEWAKTVLETRNRSDGGITASPHGLYLTGVDYPQPWQTLIETARTGFWKT
ncbi:tRNA pseudouridine(38-40) synthase TruA [Candidatus Venteria ishoeyi]|uniref:tRNA pseudouridine synthase A n=1 Tax=Candidatus Venteria ishoeyi TaxID=1899563 RepID=A0A1H6F344_9GAMM|nr:tRNA pseudouridine(38-40) synthase TruA [Candidatus Venteria ishoeyi]SEH04540.1 tRNA pseudouridine synthase A [Candidatus Venteria ishoeyi]